MPFGMDIFLEFDDDRHMGEVHPNVAKAGGLQSHGAKGEAVVWLLPAGNSVHAALEGKIENSFVSVSISKEPLR